MNDVTIGWAICIVALAWLAIAAIARDKAGEIDYLVDLALTVDAEEDEWAPWLRQVPDLDETPLYVETWAHVFRHQLDDPEAVERFIGGAA